MIGAPVKMGTLVTATILMKYLQQKSSSESSVHCNGLDFSPSTESESRTDDVFFDSSAEYNLELEQTFAALLKMAK